MERSFDLLPVIDQLTQQAGYPPTVREVGQALGLRSSSTVHHHIHKLVELGLAQMRPDLPRTLRLTEEGRRQLATPAAAAAE
jgi:repressor LexA